MNPKKMQYRSRRAVKKQYGKKEIYAMGIIAVILVLLFSYYRYTTKNYNYLKEDKREYIVYTKTKTSYGKYTKEVPYINMKSDNIKTINSDIQQFGNKYLNIEKSILTYEYNINGQILSVILKAASYENKSYPEVEFLSYNINLETKEVIDDDTLLSYYGLDSNYVSNKIEQQFKSYYSELAKEKYFASQECNFNCFLDARNVSSYLKNIEYYIDGGSLYAYKPFLVVSIYGEENYFTEEDFVFEIATVSE